MTRERLLRLLQDVAAGTATPAAALDHLAWAPVEAVAPPEAPDSAFARLDLHRASRHGYPEVVFCPGKTAAQLVSICERLASRGDGFLATRADEPARQALATTFTDARVHDTARVVHLPPAVEPDRTGKGTVVVVSAGTGDLPVAEEAAVVANALGNPVERLYDVGVAGIHRILGEAAVLRRAAVAIVVAGMEGALPSVVGGLLAVPVIAVPTSVGYGTAFGGVTPLLAMLTSCAAGVTVVNIDNGFGAAAAATRINHALARLHG